MSSSGLILTQADLKLDANCFPKVAGDDDFQAPEEILKRPEYIFGYHVAVLYNSMEGLFKLADRFGVSHQSIWVWRSSGVPLSRRKTLIKVLSSVDEPLRLASNVTIDDLIRPYGDATRNREVLRAPNAEWLDLLREIETGNIQGLDRSNIPELCGPRQMKRSTPYFWGWDTGGVPATIKGRVWKKLIDWGVHDHFGMTEREFEGHCEKRYGLLPNQRETKASR